MQTILKRIFCPLPFNLACLSISLPLIALVLSYILSAYNGHSEWCFPNLEGCTSISKAARQPSSLLIFQILMASSTIFIVQSWDYSAKWLISLGDKDYKALLLMKRIGQFAALFLLVYLVFLGTKGQAYQFMRRFGVIIYFGGTGIAQLLFLRSVDNLHRSGVKFTINLKICLSFILYTMLFLAISQVAASLFTQSDNIDNIIEWNFAVLMHVFFLLLAIEWRKKT